MDAEALKLLGGGSLAAALLALIYIVGMRMVAAIDRIGTKVDNHTTVDIAHHAEVREELVAMSARIDTALDLTPVRPQRHKTNPRGVAVGYRSPRPGTHNDGDD